MTPEPAVAARQPVLPLVVTAPDLDNDTDTGTGADTERSGGVVGVVDEREGTPWGTRLPWVNVTGGPPLTVLQTGEWMADAACVGTDPDAFFAATKYPKAAVRTCLGCPVAEACLAAALVYGDTHGLRGGTVPRHRRRLAARLRAGDTLGHVVTDGVTQARWAAAARGLHPPTDADAGSVHIQLGDQSRAGEPGRAGGVA